MQIDIQSRSLPLTGSLLEHVVQRVGYFLGHVRDHVHNVRVQLCDVVNAPHGGHDKRCVVQVKLNHLRAVVTEETQIDVLLAVDRALDRAGRSVTQRLERPRERRSGAPPNMAPTQLAQLPLELRANPTSPTPHSRSIH